MTVIEAQNLRKTYGATVALDGIDLRVDEGHILGIIGPNGAGKSTALNAILGLTSYEGELKVLGRNPWTERDHLMREVCFISDVAIMPRWMKVSHAFEYVAGVHPRFDRAKALGFLAKTSIKGTSRVRELSKGMVAQLHLALVMAIDAKLLVLDEPTLGLDILYRKQFYDSLLNDYFDHNRTIVVTTHQVEDIQHVLTDLMFINRGRIVLSCSMEEFEARYFEVMVNPEHIQAARAFKPIHERSVLGRTILLFDNADQQQLAALGDVHTPSIADMFVAVMSQPTRSHPMNTQSNEIPNSLNTRRNSSTQATTRPFYWSVRRELWENRYVTIVPLAVAAVALFGFLIATIGRALATPDLAQRRAVLEEPYHFVTALIMGAAFIVGIFYSLDALHGERRDRSILFWKSLPVSDLTTVLSKLSVPIVFLPLFSFAIVVLAQLTMFSLSSLAMLGSGMNVGSLWVPLFRDLTMLLYHLFTVHMLWYAPVYAWIVLISCWARRAVFLWAALPALALFAIEKIAFRTDHVLNFLEYRLSGPEPFDMAGSHFTAMDSMANLNLAKFLTTPGLWAGLAFAALFLFAAARLRRQQGPT